MYGSGSLYCKAANNTKMTTNTRLNIRIATSAFNQFTFLPVFRMDFTGLVNPQHINTGKVNIRRKLVENIGNPKIIFRGWVCLFPDSIKKAASGCFYQEVTIQLFYSASFSFFFLLLLGAIMMNILLPSSFGSASGCPISCRRSANFNNNSSPLSLNWIARPLN